MVKKRSGNSGKIWAYILTQYKLGLNVTEIYKETCEAIGHNEVSYTTVARWIRKFKYGQEPVNYLQTSGRKCSAITKLNIQKDKDIIAQDARYTEQNIARMVGISVESAFTILKKILKVKRLTAHWIPPFIDR